MDSGLHRLLPLFAREKTAGRPLVLATLVTAAGSTYRKPGAQMLIAQDGEYAGLLSGGCLEGDLVAHAADVVHSGVPRLVDYDMRDPADMLFGMGSGCEGAMSMLLQRVGPAEHWQPLDLIAAAHAAHRALSVAFVLESTHSELPVGSFATSDDVAATDASAARRSLARAAQTAAHDGRARRIDSIPGLHLVAMPLELPPRLLVLGGGPDAVPLVELAAFLGWKVTLADHREAHATLARFPRAERVLCMRPERFHEHLGADEFAAAIVMTHHLPSDVAWLAQLAGSPVPYVGLLGPPARRDKILAELGTVARELRARLHAPVGFDLGARSPEAIALSIVAEIQATLTRVDATARTPDATRALIHS